MNFGTLLGFLAAIAVFAGTVVSSLTNVKVVADGHAALIVVGGTVAATLICFPAKKLVLLLRVFVRRMFGRNQRDFNALIREIGVLSEAKRKGMRAFEAAIPTVNDLFLRDAAQVLFWSQSEISEEELRDLLDTRVATHLKIYTQEAKIFRTMSKFPPAFGLLGTTIGMIALLQSLGGADARTTMGPSMAIALVATLYGLVLTNFLFIPISENLQEQTQEDHTARSIVVEGIMLIQAGKPSRYIEEKVSSFLLPKQRAQK